MGQIGSTPEVSLMVDQVAMFDQLDAAAKRHLLSRWNGQGMVQLNNEGKTKEEVFHLLFGDSSSTRAREQYYSIILELSTHVDDRESLGWAQRTADNNGIDTLETTYDWHVWLEDDSGNIFDYPDSELCIGCDKKTDQVVRKEWRKDLVQKIKPRIMAMADGVIADLDKSGHDASTVLSAINAGTFPRDRAHVRAKVLYDSDPTKYKIIIGSLGFVQDNGRVYWNLG
jgi:hypothetical protein